MQALRHTASARCCCWRHKRDLHRCPCHWHTRYVPSRPAAANDRSSLLRLLLHFALHPLLRLQIVPLHLALELHVRLHILPLHLSLGGRKLLLHLPLLVLQCQGGSLLFQSCPLVERGLFQSHHCLIGLLVQCHLLHFNLLFNLKYQRCLSLLRSLVELLLPLLVLRLEGLVPLLQLQLEAPAVGVLLFLDGHGIWKAPGVAASLDLSWCTLSCGGGGLLCW
mmetsp:Transcript_60967/g.169038  ORF Transcript_60967/g.169038 Transcript_60967/m.169038 type:complete len:222 (-) Transcript_60967:501-1166(-)